MNKEMSDKTSELLNCPFCGGEIKQMFMNEETFTDCVWDESIGNVSTWFKCYKCDSEFFHDEPIDTPEKQAEWWNTRIPMQNIVEQLEKELQLFAYGFCEEYFSGVLKGIMKAIEIAKEEGGLNELQNNK